MALQPNLKKKNSFDDAIGDSLRPSLRQFDDLKKRKPSNTISPSKKNQTGKGRMKRPSSSLVDFNRMPANQEYGQGENYESGQWEAQQPQGTLHSWESDFQQYPQQEKGEEQNAAEEEQSDANELAREKELEQKKKSEEKAEESAGIDLKNPYQAIQKILSYIEMFTAVTSSAGDVFVSLPAFLVVANGELLVSFLFPIYKISPLKKKLIILADVIMFLIMLVIAVIIYQAVAITSMSKTM